MFVKIENRKPRFSRLNNIRLRTKLFLMSILPMVILGVIIMFVVSNTYINNAVKQTEEDLYAITASTIAAYEQNSGKYFFASNGNLWKGSYNISKSNVLIDGVKERTGTDITVIDKDGVIVTTAVDDKKGKNQDFKLDGNVKKMIFDQNEVFSDQLMIDGVRYYFSAIPLVQDNTDEVIGAVITSVNKDKRLSTAYEMVRLIVVISMILIIVSSIFTILVSSSITKGFKAGFKIIELVSKGKLNADTSRLDIGRRDEIGDMFRNIVSLQQSLKKIVSKNIQMSVNIGDDVEELDAKAIAAKDSVGIVDEAIVAMTNVARTQSEMANKVTNDIGTLGEMIENTYSGIQSLNNFNTELQSSNITANKVLEDLSSIKSVLNGVIEVISKQTKDTYELTKDIRKYAQMITEFAGETNLLALNASIEAARVGEKGKGFAIVANQIQALADQSNIVSNDITKTVKLLVEDTKKSVQTMDNVTDIIDKLNQNIEDTKDVFKAVNVNVERSIDGLKVIEDQAAIMDDTRESITNVVKELEDVMKVNMKSVANTKEVTRHIGDLFEQSKNIKEATSELLESINIFEM